MEIKVYDYSGVRYGANSNSNSIYLKRDPFIFKPVRLEGISDD